MAKPRESCRSGRSWRRRCERRPDDATLAVYADFLQSAGRSARRADRARSAPAVDVDAERRGPPRPAPARVARRRCRRHVRRRAAALVRRRSRVHLRDVRHGFIDLHVTDEDTSADVVVPRLLAASAGTYLRHLSRAVRRRCSSRARRPRGAPAHVAAAPRARASARGRRRLASPSCPRASWRRRRTSRSSISRAAASSTTSPPARARARHHRHRGDRRVLGLAASRAAHDRLRVRR